MGLENESCKFKIGKNVQLRKLMNKYSELIGIPRQVIRFRLDGINLDEEASAASFPIFDEDVIETFLQQTGGGSTGNNDTLTKESSSDNEKKREHESRQVTTNPNLASFSTCHQRWDRMRQKNMKKTNQRQEKTNTVFHRLPNIKRIFQQPGPLTIALEGNIGAGKSTFLHALAGLAPAGEIVTFQEPLNEWQSVEHTNLLKKLYQDPTRWSFAFQSFAMLSMVKNHQHKTNIKIMKRSIFSGTQVFLKAHEVCGTINPVYAKILRAWQKHFEETMPLNIDLVIYFKTKPETAWERIRNRNRPEEKSITLDYIRILHTFYEEWMTGYSRKKMFSMTRIIKRSGSIKKKRRNFNMAQRYVDLYQHLHPPFNKNETEQITSKERQRFGEGKKGRKEEKPNKKTQIHQKHQSRKAKEVIIECQKCHQEVERGNHSKFACALNCHQEVLRKFNSRPQYHKKKKINPVHLQKKNRGQFILSMGRVNR